ncbi:MAG: GntR family transcriptional regulator [Chloroflexi bacterium]|nr:GntR family transcriptional regulator [Chloroflexota bacterium]
MISSTLTELIARLNVVATGPERKTLKTQLIEVLREAIVTGLLPPDSRLIEREISDRLGVSRLPVRDALNQLEGEGLVVNTEGGRQVIDLDEATVRDLCEFRLALEGLAVHRATQRIGPEEIDCLRGILAKMRHALETDDLVDYGVHDFELHAQIWRYAGNRLVQREMGVLGRMVSLLATRDAGPRVLAIHEELVQRMAAGDPTGAIETIERHMAHSLEACLRAIQEDANLEEAPAATAGADDC